MAAKVVDRVTHMNERAREQIPQNIVDEVLYRADHICCICRENGKGIQIHHIDGDRNNNSPDNLAVLCLEHHRKVHLRGGFGRQLSAGEVQRYRDDWNRSVEQRRALLVRRTEEQFTGFEPSLTQDVASAEDESQDTDTSFLELEEERTREYREQRGLFLIHYWRPSDKPDQVADIVIRLHQHNLGPLSEGEVESVEYQLGPKFSVRPVEISDPTNYFELEVSAYRPMLCLAKVNLTDGTTLKLTRFIDFPVDE
jgi:hypothetical protein